jgi:hypothetical protein
MKNYSAKIEYAKFLDYTLLRFNGNKTVSLEELKIELGNQAREYFLAENALKRLSGDGMITPIRPDMTHGTPVVGSYYLSDKGWAVLTRISEYGYEKIERKKRSDQCKDGFRFWSIFLITTAALIVTIYQVWISSKQSQ